MHFPAYFFLFLLAPVEPYDYRDKPAYKYQYCHSSWFCYIYEEDLNTQLPTYSPKPILECVEKECEEMCLLTLYRLGGECITFGCKCYGLPRDLTMNWPDELERIALEEKKTMKKWVKEQNKINKKLG